MVRSVRLLVTFGVYLTIGSNSYAAGLSDNPYKSGPFLLSGNSCELPEGTCIDHVKFMDNMRETPADVGVFNIYCQMLSGKQIENLCERKKNACGSTLNLRSNGGMNANLVTVRWSASAFETSAGCELKKPI